MAVVKVPKISLLVKYIIIILNVIKPMLENNLLEDDKKLIKNCYF